MIYAKILTIFVAAAWLGKALFDAVIRKDINAVIVDFAAFQSTVAVQAFVYHPPVPAPEPDTPAPPVSPTIVVVPAAAAQSYDVFTSVPSDPASPVRTMAERTNAGDTSAHCLPLE